ncbi:MAG: OprO/OprP family phosphate-selective porin [Methylophilales bacterium]|nr:OprO/OprP family phosphate-selective porin [Methylophilales bacterium]
MQRTMKPRVIALAVSSVLMLACSQVALADSSDDLLKKLKDKGILTEQEYDEFNATRDTEKVKKQSEIKASFKDGIVWESGDKQHSMQISGRVQLDGRAFGYDKNDLGNAAPAGFAGVANGTAVGSNNFALRRARIAVKGKFYNSYEYEISTNLQQANGNAAGSGGVGATDDVAFLNVNWWEEAQFRFGQFKMPMTQEKMTSSNNIDFMERSFVNQMAPNEELGAMVHGVPFKGWTYALAVSNGAGQNSGDVDNRVDDKDFIGRVTANAAEWMDDKTMILHGGVAFSKGDVPVGNIGAGGTVQTQSGVRFHTLPVLVAATTAGSGPSRSIDRQRVGLEGIAAYGPFKIQGEWLRTSFDYDTTTSASTSVDQDAWYVEAMWILTGEKYADFYKNGVMGALKPKNEFVHPMVAASTDGWGLWELGVRFDKYDASDFITQGLGTTVAAAGTTNGVTRGSGYTEANEWTVGIKFLPNPNFRVMLNYVKTEFANPYTATGGVTVNNKLENGEDALLMRTQIMF